MSTAAFDDVLGGADDPPMVARLSEVEKAVVRIDATLQHLATKDDVQEAVASTQRWMVATVLGMMIGFSGMFFAMSNALKATPSTPAQPTVIVVPSHPAAGPASTR